MTEVEEVLGQSAVRAVREIITAAVVHRDHQRTAGLVDEHLAAHGTALVVAASTFIAHHATDAATPELAEDRFFYLLTRVGDLIDLAAEVSDVDQSQIVLEIAEALDQIDGPDRQSFRAAQTCLVAHLFVRRGRPPWGIQRHLNRDDMLVLNDALAQVLVMIAAAFEGDALDDVFVVLLGEARHILSCQAQAYGVTVEDLVEDYFTALAAKEASC